MTPVPPNGTPADGDCPLTFDAFYESYKLSSLGYVARRVRDPHKARDVHQEAWTSIYIRFTEGPIPDNWPQFIWGVIRNKIGDYRREHYKDPEYMDIPDLDYFAQRAGLTTENPDIGEIDEQRRLRAAVEDALRKLTVLQRQAVLLRYADGFTFPEIENVMKVSHSTARKHVERGIAAIRKSLAEAGFLVPAKEVK